MIKKILANKKLVADIILVASLLVISLSVFIVVRLTKQDGDVAVVTVNNVVVGEYPLYVDGEYSLNGGTNILVIENGKAFVTYANCPDGLCVNQGKISLTGDRIVCLPNKLMIEIRGVEEEILG